MQTLFFLLILGSCAQAQTTSALQWPTSEGTRWVFTDADGQDGLVITTEGQDRLSFRGASVFWSGAGIVIDQSGEDWMMTVSTSYLGDSPNEPAWTILDLPLSAGKRWRSGRTEGDTLFTFNATVVGSETVTAPVGQYTAWHVAYRLDQHLGTERDFDAWFADGVGLVKLTQVAQSTRGEKRALDTVPTWSLASIDEVATVTAQPIQPGDLLVQASTSGVGKKGKPLPVSFALKNQGNRAFHVIAALDASDVGWRYPKITVEIEHADGTPVEMDPGARCGLINPLESADLRPLGPGESLDPFGPGSFGHYAMNWTPTQRGDYRVRMVYDLGEHANWTEVSAETQGELTTIPTGEHTSNWTTVTVR